MNRLLVIVVKLVFVVFSMLLISCNFLTQNKSEEITLFNGENLDKWRGNSKVWSVEDACIVGRTTEVNTIDQNTFLIYKDEFSDFELTFQYKIIGGNSGVQYRSKVIDEVKFVVGGYQADMEAGINYSGILYEEKGRGIIANRGEEVIVLENGEKEITKFTSSEAIQGKINNESWNDYKIVANKNHLQHYINNTKTVDVRDNETYKNSNSGVIALQVHAGPNMTVYYKNLVIKPIRN